MSIEELRQKINDIDSRLVKDFDERMKVALEIEKYKKENNMPVLDPAREREVINRQTGCVDESMAMYVKLLYNTIFDISRSYQQRYLTERTEPPDDNRPDEKAEREDEAFIMKDLICHLPQRERRIMTMYLLEEQSYDEIEASTGLKQGNIRQIVMRTRQKL